MKIGGQEREFRFGLNAIRALIRATGKTPMEIIQSGLDPTDFELGIHIIWAGLLWTNKNITPDIVGAWLDADPPGTYTQALIEAGNALVKAFERCFATGDIEEEGEKKGKN